MEGDVSCILLSPEDQANSNENQLKNKLCLKQLENEEICTTPTYFGGCFCYQKTSKKPPLHQLYPYLWKTIN